MPSGNWRCNMKTNPLGWNCLGFFEEAVGTLHGMAVEEGILIAQISRVRLALPLELEDKLQPLIGKRMGVLHTDIRGKEYLVRSIPEPKMEIDQATPDTHQLKASA